MRVKNGIGRTDTVMPYFSSNQRVNLLVLNPLLSMAKSTSTDRCPSRISHLGRPGAGNDYSDRWVWRRRMEYSPVRTG
jgi:hypothetical protein